MRKCASEFFGCDIQRVLIFLNRFVIFSDERQRFAAGDRGANAQLRTGFQQVVVRIDGDAVGLSGVQMYQF